MSLKSLSVLFGVVLVASVGCGDSGTGGSGGGSAGGDTGGSPGSGGTPDTGGAPDGGAPEGGAPEGGAPGTGGAGGAPGGMAMSFDGSGFNPHNDQNLYVQVRNAAGTVVADDMAAVSGGTFSFTFPDLDVAGGNVDYYADVNDDNACTTAGQPDHVWRVPIPANQIVAVTHNTDFSQEACDGF